MSDKNQVSSAPDDNTNQQEIPGWLSGVGFILTIAYPVLALSVGVRASFRIVESVLDGTTIPLNALLSSLTAGFYIVATIGFAKRAKWAWRISLTSLGLETISTFVVGTLSLLPAYSDTIGRTAWRAFGQDYGYLPLILPIFGLIWLLHPETRRAYGIGSEHAKS